MAMVFKSYSVAAINKVPSCRHLFFVNKLDWRVEPADIDPLSYLFVPAPVSLAVAEYLSRLVGSALPLNWLNRLSLVF